MERPKLDDKGRVVIPAELRKDLDLQEGQEFMARSSAGCVILVPVTVTVEKRKP